MPDEPPPTPDEAIHALTDKVTERVRRGEKVATIRAELIAGGLNSEIVDHILAEAASHATSGTRTTVAMIMSGVIVVACSLAGLAGGVWAASEIEPAPGLAAMATCLFGAIVVILGAVGGAGVGLGIAALLAKWTARDLGD